MYSRAELAAGFRSLGVGPGDSIMLHASVRSVGPVAGGPDQTSSQGAHPHWPDRFFGRIVDAFLAKSGNPGGRVGDAESHLLDARALLEFALPIMSAIAADPGAATALNMDAHPGTLT